MKFEIFSMLILSYRSRGFPFFEERVNLFRTEKEDYLLCNLGSNSDNGYRVPCEVELGQIEHDYTSY